jgi:hypothetical protein
MKEVQEKMAKTHNKKRNVGIIYEQLLRYISKSLVDGDEEKARLTSDILKKHFHKESQLYREFRLFNALVKTTVESESLANRILDEAKKAAITFDPYQLRKEKAALIKEINYEISDTSFYAQRVGDYRSYATIQTLLNDWRKGTSADLSRIAKYEGSVNNWLLTEKKDDDISCHKNEDVNSLTVKIMTEKFNKKYGSTLNSDQTNLIKEYVFSLSTGKTEEFKEYLSYLKRLALHELSSFSKTCENDILNEKINIVHKNITSLMTNEINDETISRFLLVSGLKDELTENENG